MFDHVAIEASDLARSRAFYEMTLAPLGIEVVSEPVPHMVGIGSAGKPRFWLMGRDRPTARGVQSTGAWQTASTLLPSGSSTKAA